MPIDRKAFKDYEYLPDIIRGMVSREEYAWLSDSEKQNILLRMTAPEPDAEDPAY